MDNPKYNQNCTTTSHTISGLDTTATLTFYVASRKDGKYSDKVSGKYVLNALPSAPASITTKNVTTKTATIQWSASNGADSYQILKSNKTVIDTTTNCSYMVTELNENTSYKYYIVPVKNGKASSVSEKNAVSFTTKEDLAFLTENKNIKLTYGSTTFWLGETWSTSILNGLKSNSNGYEKVTRTAIEDAVRPYGMDVHMFDTNEYDNFLTVYVSNGKVMGWLTNGEMFGTYYGKDIVWGDRVDKYTCGMGINKNAREMPSSAFRDLDDKDSIFGGFRYTDNPGANYTASVEKKIGFHFINAFRVAAGVGLAPLAYDDEFDGGNKTWSGTFYSSDSRSTVTYTNVRYGAQPLAETVVKCCREDGMIPADISTSGKAENPHYTEYLPRVENTVAGISYYDRTHKILEYITGINYTGENIGTGMLGESCVSIYMASNGHLSQILDSRAEVVGIGKFGRWHAEIYGGGEADFK